MAEDEEKAERFVAEYQAAWEDELRRNEPARAILGGLLGTGSVLGLVFLWIVFGFGAAEANRKGAYTIPCVTTLAVVGMVVIIARQQRITYRSKAFLLGVLVGVGVGLLIEGACFAAASRL
jgi:hypothetical protein